MVPSIGLSSIVNPSLFLLAPDLWHKKIKVPNHPRLTQLVEAANIRMSLDIIDKWLKPPKKMLAY
jgi:hypothetical protein